MITARPLWQGRTLAVLGIVLVAFSLRSAVASLSPLVEHIGRDFPMPTAIVGLLGTAPPVCFAIFGLLTPLLERRFGLERVTVIAVTAIAIGLLVRGLVTGAPTLLAATALVFAGVGMGNILMPPLVKKYFPDRLGLMMTLYSTTMAVATFLPPLVAVPVADAAGWRLSLGMWAVFALAGIVPWLAMLLHARRENGEGSAASVSVDPPPAEAPARPGHAGHESFEDAVALSTGPVVTAPASSSAFARVIRSPVAWAVAGVFTTTASLAYTAFAWLPAIMVGQTGVSSQTAGLLLSLYAFISLPGSLVVPVLVVRFRATRALYLVGAIAGVAGLLGLAFVREPGLAWLWALLYGIAGLIFPLALVLIGIRAREPETAVALSGFVQSIAYVVASVFPVLVGVLHTATGGWQASLIVLAVLLVVSIPAGLFAGRPHTVEEAWERRHGRPW